MLAFRVEGVELLVLRCWRLKFQGLDLLNLWDLSWDLVALSLQLVLKVAWCCPPGSCTTPRTCHL